MEQKENCKLLIWENLYKDFEKSILRMNALLDFVAHCMNPENETVVLNNPINFYGNIEIGKEDTLPFVTTALTEEKKKAMELAHQIKALLDEADFETWNKIVISPECRAAVKKWKETMANSMKEISGNSAC